MATITVCDGCKKPLDGEKIARGQVIVRQYCAACAEIADDFTRRRDELHTRLADEWTKGMVLLIGHFGTSIDALPDVNQAVEQTSPEP
jgi:hypothetical protein